MGANLSRHTPSTHRFDFAVTLTVIAILATLLLGYLNKAQHDIEKVIVNTELNNLRLSLAEAWLHKNLLHQPFDSEALKDSNPLLWVAEKPENYIGELKKAPSEAKAVWYFDTTKKRLVYVFNDGQQVQFRFSKTAGQTQASLLAIGGLDLMKDEVAANGVQQ